MGRRPDQWNVYSDRQGQSTVLYADSKYTGNKYADIGNGYIRYTDNII